MGDGLLGVLHLVRAGRADPVLAGVDRTLPLSDHAGFPDLVDYALQSGASSVLTVHGHAHDLAEELRRRGIDARPIGEAHRQLELFP